MDVSAKSDQAAAHFPQQDCLQPSSNTSKIPTPSMPSAVHPDGLVHVKYQGYNQFRKVVSHQFNLLNTCESTQQYLKFSEVSRSDFETLLSEQSRPCKSIRFSYHERNRILVVKAMPGPDHELTIGVFREMVNDQLAAMQVKRECLIQSSPVTKIGNWIKEPDACWGPKATGVIKFVLEVGVSESARRLAIDARGWLETPGTPVTTAVTITLGNYNNDNVVEKPITISVYNAHPIGRRNMPHSAFKTASVSISRPPGATMPTLSGYLKEPFTRAETPTDEIRLNFDMFIGRLPNRDSEGDIVLTRNLLLEFAENVWRRGIELNGGWVLRATKHIDRPSQWCFANFSLPLVAGLNNQTNTHIFKAAVYNSTAEIPVTVTFDGVSAGTAAELTVLTAPDALAMNEVGAGNIVTQTVEKLEAGAGGEFSFSLPELSIAVLKTEGE